MDILQFGERPATTMTVWEFTAVSCQAGLLACPLVEEDAAQIARLACVNADALCEKMHQEQGLDVE
jgi:hypothetical protein